MGWVMSCRTSSKFGCDRRCATFDFWLVKKLSRQIMSCPWATRRSQRCEPRKPAPPVTTMRLMEDKWRPFQNPIILFARDPAQASWLPEFPIADLDFKFYSENGSNS